MQASAAVPERAFSPQPWHFQFAETHCTAAESCVRQSFKRNGSAIMGERQSPPSSRPALCGMFRMQEVKE